MKKHGVIFLPVLLMLALFTSLSAAPERGILYFAEGGTGGGTMHFYSAKKLVRARYDREKTKMTGLNGRFRYGEYCRFQCHRESGALLLDSVAFTGEFDRLIQIADDLVRGHYRRLQEGNFTEAYRNLSPAWRKKQGLEAFRKGFEGVTFTKDMDNVPVYATKIIGHDATGVLLLVNEHYFIPGSTRYLKYEVIVTEGGYEPAWYIDRVQAITVKIWLDS